MNNTRFLQLFSRIQAAVQSMEGLNIEQLSPAQKEELVRAVQGLHSDASELNDGARNALDTEEQLIAESLRNEYRQYAARHGLNPDEELFYNDHINAWCFGGIKAGYRTLQSALDDLTHANEVKE